MLRNEKGLTLLEVLAASVILSLVVLMFLNISSFSLMSNKNDELRVNALRLAEQKLNEYRSTYAAAVPVLQNWVDINLNPLDPASPYSVYVQQSGVQNQTFSTAAFATRKFVSLQSIVLFKDTSTVPATLVPRVMTVTVYWGVAN
ncbi:prepilin-type N-terminal cleavage/methylation domain-containing protein [Paenibacillus sp. yr247]|uniref:type IV pilus modification PilV family protein n=1 Tax=Paenibacillus sp. yr247 TaxID=1761880 RepID=UPI0008910F37|nr:type II secretion system protein [Paenibacillus sp. yr247]SDN82733.1 prepilin-type N-terminal cleavage/methylation domain-containing protein [Paenibacillus sp. yr247]